MAATGAEAPTANLNQLGDARAMFQDPHGQPDNQLLQLNSNAVLDVTWPWATTVLKRIDANVPYPAPAQTRQNAGVVHSAAARVLRLNSVPEDVTYEPELMHSQWEYPANAAGAKTSVKPTVSRSIAYDDWSASIKDDLQKYSDSGVARLVIFVHGYNTLPWQANETAHRMLQPVGPDGGLGVQAVVSFTWDSAHQWFTYPGEEFMAESPALSEHLAALIRRLLHIKLDNGKRWQLVILAHSMGNRPTTLALGKVYEDERAALQLNTADAPMLVINAAADIDAITYSTTMAPIMTLLGDTARTIVLASLHDKPLGVSYFVHKFLDAAHGKEQRVGVIIKGWFNRAIGGHDDCNSVVHVSHMDVIDCSEASIKEAKQKGGSGHSYYILIDAVRADLVAAMDTPNTAERYQEYLEKGVTRLVKAPENHPKPFVKFDGPTYKIHI